MKKKYQPPVAEIINIRLLNSVLDDDENAPILPGSEESLEWGGKKNESSSDWDEEVAPTLPGNINLWDD